MINFKFEVDKESYEFCCQIANKMIEFFNISYEEAIDRINSRWSGQIIKGDNCIVFHEDEEYWAIAIYYTNDSYWWMTENRDRLKAKVYNKKVKRYE